VGAGEPRLIASAGIPGFQFEPLQIAPAVLAAVLYATRAHTLSQTPRAVPAWRQWCWYGGLALIVGTLVSPLSGLADDLFAVHMVEHLLIGDVGSLLLVLGLTGPLLAPVMRISFFDRLRILTHPLVALPLWALDFYAWHAPALQDAAVNHSGVHALQHLLFIALGANMWMCLFGPLPQPLWFGNGAKLVYIIAVRLIGGILGNVFVFGGGHFYDAYAAGEALRGVTPSEDQVAAGAIMMVWESFLTLGLFCWLFLKAAAEGEERQELLDLASQRGVELSDARAARAVSAGRGAELRARIERSAR
jgi:putative membrane protein